MTMFHSGHTTDIFPFFYLFLWILVSVFRQVIFVRCRIIEMQIPPAVFEKNRRQVQT